MTLYWFREFLLVLCGGVGVVIGVLLLLGTGINVLVGVLVEVDGEAVLE